MTKKSRLVFMVFVFMFICFAFNSFPTNCIYASTSYFARIKYSNCPLLKSPSADSSFTNTRFLIPQTYFVEILSKVSDEFFEAQYLGIRGYVRKSDIDFVAGTPQNPFADKISFRVFAQNGLNLRSSPKESEGIANRLTTIPFLETNLQYIGMIEGEEAISNRGNIWYYCNYFRMDETLTGYVYAGYCDMLTNIVQNTEQLPVIPEPNFEQTSIKNQTSDIGDGSLNKLSKRAQILIIVSVSLPALIILYLLFKPTKIVANLKASKKSPDTKKKKKRYRDDYYEIEN